MHYAGVGCRWNTNYYLSSLEFLLFVHEDNRTPVLSSQAQASDITMHARLEDISGVKMILGMFTLSHF